MFAHPRRRLRPPPALRPRQTHPRPGPGSHTRPGRIKRKQLPLLATAEIAGAAGLLAGLLWRPLGAAAAIGVITYFLGAVTAHLRIRDGNITAPTALLLAATAALTLRLLS